MALRYDTLEKTIKQWFQTRRSTKIPVVSIYCFNSFIDSVEQITTPTKCSVEFNYKDILLHTRTQ